MKKLSAILLVLCMMMSMVTAVPTFAEEVTTLTVEAETSELIKGFKDNSEAETPAIEVIGSTYARIRQGGEWISYDISSLAAGTYSVSVTWRNAYAKTKYDAGLDFIVDGELELRSYTAVASTAVEENKLIGSIYVPEGAEELKIKNHGFATVDLDVFTLTFLGVKDTSSKIRIYAQNATSVNDVTGVYSTYALGTDYYDYRCKAYDKSKFTVECDHECAVYAEGLGWHYPFENVNVTVEDHVIMHGGNWVRYDISDFKPGYYDLTMHIAGARNTSAATIRIDEETVVSDFALTAVGVEESDKSTFGTAYDAELGVIYIPEDATYMYIENKGGIAFKPSYIDFERLNMMVIDKDTECVSFDAHDEDLEEPLVDGDYVIYEPSGEWISYDISSLEAGTYEVEVDYVSEVKEARKMRGLDFVVDGNLELRSYLAQKTTSSKAEVGKIYLPEGAEELKIKNHGFYQIKVKSVSLKYVGEEDTSENITISAQNATSSYIDGAAKSILLEDYFDNSCKSEAVAKKQDQASTAHLEGGATCYHFPFTNTAVASGEYVQHNPGEWTRYDISDLKPGTYQVEANMYAIDRGEEASVAELRIGDVTSEVIASSVVPIVYDEAAAAYQWSDVTIGLIDISDEDEYLILKCNDDGDYYQVKTLTFTEYIPDETNVSYSSDAEGANTIDSLDGLDEAYVNVNLLRPSKPEAIAETIVVALYDGSKLESIIKVTPVTVGYEFSETYEVTGLSDLTEPTIKVFVWDSLTGMDPVISNASISISYES